MLDSPFAEPNACWRISEHDPPEWHQGRRPAVYYHGPTVHDAAVDREGAETAVELKLVNRIRTKASGADTIPNVLSRTLQCWKNSESITSNH